ncbi:hypothetical protein LF1_09630 [Rubripirellula obstinata]|uniref:Uncharacterized protein n=1 Tax=Rubripirellula obstinata TaxID=406547 RepID=A0A5B1CG06_9BACT|nr:hypothetical protein LF1_09630 [Rubripirellula obstinata]
MLPISQNLYGFASIAALRQLLCPPTPGRKEFSNCLTVWASPRASTRGETRGAMPTRLNDFGTLHGVPPTPGLSNAGISRIAFSGAGQT